MTRCLPPSSFKTKYARAHLREVPQDGSKIREMYDFFLSRKGQVVSPRISARLREDLQSYYGLDIRKVGYGQWVLCGEWFGKVYIDYLAEHLSKEGMEA